MAKESEFNRERIEFEAEEGFKNLIYATSVAGWRPDHYWKLWPDRIENEEEIDWVSPSNSKEWAEVRDEFQHMFPGAFE